MHDTNLRSCPALNRLRQMTQDERAACPAAFEGLLDVCKAQVTAIVTSLLSARPSQLSECYDARDLRAPLYSCATCGVRPIARPLSPHRRIALGDLVPVFEYVRVGCLSCSLVYEETNEAHRLGEAARRFEWDHGRQDA